MIALLMLAAAAPDIAAARSSLVGRWQGKLEYRDYQADKWFGLPVRVEVRDGGDGVTLIRTADYDDGPKTGNVRITTVSMLAADGTHESSATFRKGKSVEVETSALKLTAAKDATHWTLVETVTATDDDRPATIRLTSTRDGDSLVTLKEVDFTDDAKPEWLARNRTTLTAVR
jgi:hypothetical protein